MKEKVKMESQELCHSVTKQESIHMLQLNLAHDTVETVLILHLGFKIFALFLSSHPFSRCYQIMIFRIQIGAMQDISLNICSIVRWGICFPYLPGAHIDPSVRGLLQSAKMQTVETSMQ
jgi:hypothetical protein